MLKYSINKKRIYSLLRITLQSLIVLLFSYLMIIVGMIYSGLAISKDSVDFFSSILENNLLFIAPLIYILLIMLFKIKVSYIKLLLTLCFIGVIIILIVNSGITLGGKNESVINAPLKNDPLIIKK